MVDITSTVTLSCCSVSLIGSLLILGSYIVARTKTKPKAAMLIRNLAFSDLIWFSCVLMESAFWLNNGTVPKVLCYILSPLVNFFRMASLIWTSAISLNVLMSVTKRKWLWKSEDDEWDTYRYSYYACMIVLAAPPALVIIITQHLGGNDDAGCSSGYEYLGPWWEILIVEMIPIFLIFIFNVFVCFWVYRTMSLKSFPQSVRKRRRRIMYHFSLVFVICWAPTIIYYILQMFKLNIFIWQLFSRATLYLTGFFNFIVFGLQDPHLRRSSEYIYGKLVNSVCHSRAPETELISNEVEKTVMFDVNTISKPPRRLRYQRYKLSDLDKQNLYEERPDLDPEGTLEDPLISTSNKFGSFKSSNGKLIISEDMSRIPSYRGGNSLLTQADLSSSDEEDEEDEELRQSIQ